MPKKTTAPAPSVAPVLSIAEIIKLSIKDQCARFAERATVSARAFAEMGKLHNSITAGLKKGQTIYGELRKLGVKDSTISNASYASKVIELVKAGHLTEAQYDGFTFADCLAICRAQSDKSRRKLTAEEVAAVVAAQPETFDAEFTSIYETGLTVEEAVAQAEREQKRKAVGEVQDQIDSTLDALDEVLNEFPDEPQGYDIPPVDEDSLDVAVWNAHHDAVKALLAKAQKELATAQAKAELEAAEAARNTPPVSETPAPSTEAPSAETSEPPPANVTPAEAAAPGTSGGGEMGEHPSVESTPQAETTAPAPANETPAPPVETTPSNVHPLPSQDPDAALEEVLGALDSIPATTAGFSRAAQEKVFAKLNAIMAALDEQINEPARKVA